MNGSTRIQKDVSQSVVTLELTEMVCTDGVVMCMQFARENVE